MDRIAQYRLCLNAESYIKNIMHFRDRVRPLFVYVTGYRRRQMTTDGRNTVA